MFQNIISHTQDGPSSRSAMFRTLIVCCSLVHLSASGPATFIRMSPLNRNEFAIFFTSHCYHSSMTRFPVRGYVGFVYSAATEAWLRLAAAIKVRSIVKTAKGLVGELAYVVQRTFPHCDRGHSLLAANKLGVDVTYHLRLSEATG